MADDYKSALLFNKPEVVIVMNRLLPQRFAFDADFSLAVLEE